MQRSAGNQAVGAMLQRMRDEAPAAGAARQVARTEDDGEVDETPQFPPAVLDESAASELEEGEPEDEQVLDAELARTVVARTPSERRLSRHSISSGLFKKRVKFKLDALDATLPAGLQIRPGASLGIGSESYDVRGQVTAKGPASEVGKYELGFVQTVFRSSRRFSYGRRNHKPGLAERLLPSAFGTGLKVDDTTGLLPVKDGDTYSKGNDKGEKLYYEIADTKTFGAAAQDTQATTLYDQPESAAHWSEKHHGEDVFLSKTRGLDTFRTWLVIRKKSWGSTDYRRLAYVDWRVNYKTDITPDYANPAGSQVTAGPTSGGEIERVVKGIGVYLPVTGADSANDRAHEAKSNRKG